MHLYLRHPVHGTKVAISDLEAELDEQHGWVRYEPVSDPSSAAPASEVVNVFEAKRRRRVQQAPEE